MISVVKVLLNCLQGSRVLEKPASCWAKWKSVFIFESDPLMCPIDTLIQSALRSRNRCSVAIIPYLDTMCDIDVYRWYMYDIQIHLNKINANKYFISYSIPSLQLRFLWRRNLKHSLGFALLPIFSSSFVSEICSPCVFCTVYFL